MDTNEIAGELLKVVAAGTQPRTYSEVSSQITSLVATEPGPAVAPSGAAVGSSAVNDAVSANTTRLDQLRMTLETHAASIAENTKAVTENTSSQGPGVASQVGDAVKNLASGFGAGIMVSPILSGILKLFGGGGTEEAPAPLVKFALPSPIRVEAGVTGGSVVPTDYGQGGQVRPAAATSSTQVTVQVQAIDSRSFLDHSDAIAAAVKKAMLDSNSLNDVVSEL